MDDLLHFDHRKMLIIDGRVAFVGGTGIEDHYTDERFYDSMVRVTGPVVGQLQALFLAAYRYQGGTLPTDEGSLDHLVPRPGAGPMHARTTVLDNVPGEGHQRRDGVHSTSANEHVHRPRTSTRTHLMSTAGDPGRQP